MDIQRGDRLVIHHYAPGCRFNLAADKAQNRRLATSAPPHDGNQFPARNAQAYVA